MPGGEASAAPHGDGAEALALLRQIHEDLAAVRRAGAPALRAAESGEERER